MNNIVYIAYDNADDRLGHFFQSCHDEIREAAVKNNIDYRPFTSDILTKENINLHTSNAEEYIFSAFSHGTDSSLLCGNNPYIEADDNVKNFYSSIFYTFACNTANGIGKEFLSAYVLGYFGYSSDAWVVPSKEDIFVKCAVKGLKSYIEGKTLKEAKVDMIAEYDKYLSNAKVSPVYAFLLKNKQALVTIINDENKVINQ